LRGAILDRDGTLVDVVRDEESGAIGVAFHPDHLRLLPGVVEGLRALRAAGWSLAIATNQPGPAKGQFSTDAVRRTNAALLEQLAAEGIELAGGVHVCMHHPSGGAGGNPSLVLDCECRKPRPQLLLDAAASMGIPIDSCWMIGDHIGDIEAAHAAGARGALVFDERRCELCPMRQDRPTGHVKPDLTGRSVADIAAKLLAGP
jgi:D-glycero-D-manno-heptose 1,7-bisphosphate phosphatase